MNVILLIISTQLTKQKIEHDIQKIYKFYANEHMFKYCSNTNLNKETNFKRYILNYLFILLNFYYISIIILAIIIIHFLLLIS